VAELRCQREDVALVVVDTSTAYFHGEDENSNTDALEHAKWLRSFSNRIPGNPIVLVCCHPVKFATIAADLIPRGGSAFINEVDGNLACVKKGDLTIVSQSGKYRDTDFPEIPFRRFVVFPTRFEQKMPTVLARHASKHDIDQNSIALKMDDRDVLQILAGLGEDCINAAVGKQKERS
jgi:hypothetical protein